MVVIKLQSYVENKIPGAVYSSNLRELISQELKCGGRTPTILLDESAAFSLFQTKRVFYVDWQPNILKKDVENFVKNIISCGANLTVVLRGNFCSNVSDWFLKKRSAFIDKKQALNIAVREGIENTNSFNYFRTRQCVSNTFASISNNHYEVYQAVEYTHKEVAEIAISRNCLAVIGQDSNYLIYEGIRNYISIRSLNTETLDCEIYSRNKLMEHLGLKSRHLPLFATLCGNDVVQVQNLVHFHKVISKPGSDKFLCLAERIKGFSDDPYEHVEDMVNLINNHKINSKVIIRSIDMYLNFEKTLSQNKRLVFARERKKARGWNNYMYEIFTLRVFKHSRVTAFGDPNFLPPSILMRHIRTKIYGILLHDCDETVAEYLLEEMTDLTSVKFLTPVEVIPVKPACEHPGLKQLYNVKTPNVLYLRWNLFCRTLSGNLTQYVAKSIPPRLLFPVIALHYLEVEVPSFYPRKIFKEIFEIEAFLVVAVLVHENIQLENDDFSKADERVTSLLLYFMEACLTLNMLNEACGLIVSKHESCHCNFFDGIMLHWVYKKMNEGAKWYEFFDGNIALEALFSTLMEIILN